MTKAILQFGYKKYILDAKDALAIIDMFSKAERFESKYRSKEDGGTTYHVWGDDAARITSMELMPDNLYRMAKLAGQPSE